MSGDTAWMLVSAALVMFMVPGLAGLQLRGHLDHRQDSQIHDRVAGLRRRRDDRTRPGTARRDRLQRMMIDIAGPGSIVQQRRVLTL